MRATPCLATIVVSFEQFPRRKAERDQVAARVRIQLIFAGWVR